MRSNGTFDTCKTDDHITELSRTGSEELLKRQLRTPFWGTRKVQVG